MQLVVALSFMVWFWGRNSKSPRQHTFRNVNADFVNLILFTLISVEQNYLSPRQTILPSFTMTTSSGVPSSKITVGLYCTMSICTVERAGWP